MSFGSENETLYTEFLGSNFAAPNMLSPVTYENLLHDTANHMTNTHLLSAYQGQGSLLRETEQKGLSRLKGLKGKVGVRK